jgi:MoaA/NifB/PqqE/SkfB family radical SAM enzyme
MIPKIEHIWNWAKIALYYNLTNGRAPSPQTVKFEMTYNCNLSCVMCPIIKKFRYSQKYNELTLDEIKKLLIPQLLEMKVKNIILTGGEPLVRENALSIIHEFENNGFNTINLITNLSFDSKYLRDLPEMDVIIHTSIDGPENVHNIIRGSVDAFKKTIAAMKYINEVRADIGLEKVHITCTIQKANANTFSKVIDIANDVGSDFVGYSFVIFVIPKDYEYTMNVLKKEGFKPSEQTNTSLPKEIYNVNINEIYDECKKTIDKAKELGINLIFYPSHINNLIRENIHAWFSNSYFSPIKKCKYFYSNFKITPDGFVSPCFKVYLGNIRETSLKEIWNSEDFKRFRVFMKNRGLLPGCHRCCNLSKNIVQF